MRHVLAIGIDAEALAELYLDSSVFAVSIRNFDGDILQLGSLGRGRYDDLIIDIERCLSFPPVLVEYLRSRGCLRDGGFRLAIADGYSLALKDQLKRAGIQTCAYNPTWREDFRTVLLKSLAA